MSDYIIKSKTQALAALPPLGMFNIFLDSIDGNLKKIDSSGVVSPVSSGGGNYLEIAQNLADLQDSSVALLNIGGEPAFTKNQAFNKDFGINAGEVVEGNDSRFTDLQNNKADNSTLITAGLGLSGGGDLSSDKTIDVNTSKSITVNSDNLELVADVQTPSARKYYGTDNNGVKGWHDVRSSFIHCSGMFYAYANGRWITESDDVYGSNYYQFVEDAGLGVYPAYEWENLGTPLPKGTFVKALNFVARSNSVQTYDFKIVVAVRKPTATGGWQSGVDADGEMTNTIILNDTWQNLVGSYGGDMIDLHGANIPLNHLIDDFSMISIYIKPIENNTTTRYIFATWTWEIQ